MGNREDGADSLASQVKPASHWPGMRVLIAVVSGGNTKIFEGEPILDATAYHGLFFGLGQRQPKEHSKQCWYERQCENKRIAQGRHKKTQQHLL